MNAAILVGLGGAAGAVARFLVATRVARPNRATLIVNVLGSLLLGVITGASTGQPVALAVGVGFCGAFTTFSTFAVETSEELTSEGAGAAARLGVTHLIASLVAVGFGHLLGAVVL